MSGGSYDYLCFKDVDELVNRTDLLDRMATRLLRLGYAEDAVAETEELICIINQFRVRVETRTRRLSEVWRAVEWWDSGDSGEEALKRELANYRGENESARQSTSEH